MSGYVIGLATMASLKLLGTAVHTNQANKLAREEYAFNVKMSDSRAEGDKISADSEGALTKFKISSERSMATQELKSQALANPNLSSQSNLENLQGEQARLEQASNMSKHQADITATMKKNDADYNNQMNKTQMAQKQYDSVMSRKGSVGNAAIGIATKGLGYGYMGSVK